MGRVMSLDLNQDEIEDDLLAIASDSKHYKREADSTNWRYLRVAVKAVNSFDANSDGVRESIVAINTSGRVLWSTNAGTTWSYGNQYFKAIWVAALDGDGIYNDIVGLRTDSKLYYTRDRITWTMMSSGIVTATVGDFAVHIDDEQGTLVESAVVPVQKPIQQSQQTGWITAHRMGDQLELRSSIRANVQISWVNVSGQSQKLGQMQLEKNQLHRISLKTLVHTSGAGWIVIQSGQWSQKFPLILTH